jgi:hypothetical protein
MTHYAAHLAKWRQPQQAMRDLNEKHEKEFNALKAELREIDNEMPYQCRVDQLIERFRDTMEQTIPTYSRPSLEDVQTGKEKLTPFMVDAMNSICYYLEQSAYWLFYNYVRESEQYSKRAPSYVPFTGKGRTVFISDVELSETFRVLKTVPGIATEMVVKRAARPAEGAGWVLRINDIDGVDLTNGGTPTNANLREKTIQPWGEQVISTSATPRCLFKGWCFVITLPPGTPATCLALYRHGDSKWGGDEYEWLLPPQSTFLVASVDTCRHEIYVTYNGPFNDPADKTIPQAVLYAKMIGLIAEIDGGKAAYAEYKKYKAGAEARMQELRDQGDQRRTVFDKQRDDAEAIAIAKDNEESAAGAAAFSTPLRSPTTIINLVGGRPKRKADETDE